MDSTRDCSNHFPHKWQGATYWIALCLILGLGLVLRLLHLDHSLWIDEIRSMRDIAKNDDLILRLFHPPTYYMLMRWTSQYIGFDIVSLRSMSVFFGIGSIGFFALAMRPFGPATSLMSALILVCSPLHLQYSQEIRNYSLSWFVLAIAFYIATWVAHRPKITLPHIATLLVATVILPTINRAGFFLALIPLVYLIISRPDTLRVVWGTRRRRLISASMLLVPAAALAAYEIAVRGDILRIHARIPQYIEANTAQIIRETGEVFGADKITQMLYIVAAKLVPASPQLLVILCLGLLGLLAVAALWGPRFRWRHPLILAALSYWGAIAALSFTFKSVWIDRVLMLGLIPSAGWYAYSLSISSGFRKRIGIVALVSVCSLSVVQWSIYSASNGRENWRHIAEVLREVRRPNEPAYILHRTQILRYYGVQNLRRFYVWRGAMRMPEFSEGRDRIFVIYKESDADAPYIEMVKNYLCAVYPVCVSTGKKVVLLAASQEPIVLRQSVEDRYIHTREISRIVLDLVDKKPPRPFVAARQQYHSSSLLPKRAVYQ